MKPKEHILLGAAFTLVIWTLAPQISLIYLLLIFLTSFLIKIKALHIFHTIEFLILLGILGFFFTPFFYIFIGMLFHSLIDIIALLQERNLNKKKYFFFNWLRKKI